MLSRYLSYTILVSAFAVTAPAQTLQRKASFLGGARPGEGRCVAEVVVDGAAEVEIRGDNATLRNLKGQAPQWRRFECTGPMPVNPGGFRFRGIDGRGSQQLMQPPQNGGPAVVRIEDPANGTEGYTFEITWGGPPEVTRNVPPINGPPMVVPPPMSRPNGFPPPDRDRGGNRFSADDAVRVCQDNVRDQAARRFNASDIIFRRTRMDDQPGRNDWVTGFFEARSRSGRPRIFQFSCSVNFDNGVVRSADVQPAAPGALIFGDQATGRAIQACEVSVEQRLIRDGFRRVDFASASPDDRPGRNDFVTGTASALERDRPVWFDFTCGVSLRDGEVRSVDVNPRR
jgi:hypothetical protein